MYFLKSAFRILSLTLCLLCASWPVLATSSVGKSLMKEAAALVDKGAYEQALDVFQRAKKAFEAEKDDEAIVEVLLQAGNTHTYLGNIPAAISSYKQAIAYAKNAGLENAYLKASDALATTYFLTGSLKEALMVFDENLAIAKEKGNRKHYSGTLVQMGYTFFQLGQLDTARLLLRDALAIKDEIGDVKGQALALSYLGLFYYRLGEYERALDFYQRSIRHKEALGDSANVALMLRNISNVFIDLKDWDKAASYAQRSYDQASQLGLKRYKAEALSNLALLSLKEGAWQEALNQYQEVVSIYRASQNKLSLTENLLRMGHIYLDQGIWEQAEAQFREAEIISTEVGRQDDLMDVRLAFGKLFFEKGQYLMALDQLEKAEMIGQVNGLRPKLESIFQLLAEVHKASGHYQRSLEYYEAYSALHDSLANEKQLDRIQEMETRFQVTDKEKQIRLLNAENELQGLRLRQSRRNVWFLALLLAVGLTGAFFALLAYRTKRLANQQLAEKNVAISSALQEKEVLMREIHHRVKNNLQVISGLLKLQSTYLEDPSALAALAEGRSRVQSMALIHQNLYQEDNLTGIYTADYVPKLIEMLFHSYKVSDSRIELSTDIAPLRLDVDTAIPLGLILNELISNALKHAFPDGRSGRLKVALQEESGRLQVRVQDDGAGMQPLRMRKQQSFGFQLIEMLAEKLKARLTVDSGAGTSILLSIKNYKLV